MHQQRRTQLKILVSLKKISLWSETPRKPRIFCSSYLVRCDRTRWLWRGPETNEVTMTTTLARSAVINFEQHHSVMMEMGEHIAGWEQSKDATLVVPGRGKGWWKEVARSTIMRHELKPHRVKFLLTTLISSVELTFCFACIEFRDLPAST